MRAVFCSAVAYLGVCVAAAFLSLNLFSYSLLLLDLDFSRIGVKVCITVLGVTYVLAGVLPFLITPFSILSDRIAKKSDLNFIEFLSQTPAALFRAVKEILAATFSATAVAFPLLVIVVFAYRNLLANGVGLVNLATTFVILCVGVVLISPKILGRLFYPFLSISGTCSKDEALRHSLQYSKARLLRLLFAGLGVLFAAILIHRVSPLRFSDLRVLFDGSIFHDFTGEFAISLFHVVPFFLLLLLSFLALSFSLRDSRSEEGRERFRSLLQNNVSPYYISKLAKAGYFH